MKTAYVHCSPISVSYPNIIHLRQAAQLTGAKRFFLCIWDPVVFEDPAFFARADGKRSRMERLQENARIHQRILQLEGVEVTPIYLSEAWSRLFSKPQLARVFNAILSHVRVSDLQKKQGLPGEDLTLSRINYTIADFLVASFFHQLFPEIAGTAPGIYVSSRRLTPLLPAIRKVMEDPQSKYPIPDITWIQPFPVIIDSHGIIPSIEMNTQRIEEVLHNGLMHRKLAGHDISRLYSLINLPKDHAKRKRIVRKGRERGEGSKEGGNEGSKKEGRDHVAQTLAKDLFEWFGTIKKALEEPAPQGPSSIRITSPDEFHRSVRPLSSIKLRILALCDGSRTSYTIATTLGIKPVTASVYLGRLRTLGLITEGRKPVRTVSALVVDLASMKP